MSSRSERQKAPIIQFNEDLIYTVRTHIDFSKLSPRQKAFIEVVVAFKTDFGCGLIPGIVLKEIWTKTAIEYGYEPNNHDIISKCLADSIVLPM